MAKKKVKETSVEEVVEVKETIKKEQCDTCPRFTLAQLVASDRYAKYAYLLEVYLKADETYTLAEVDNVIRGLI